MCRYKININLLKNIPICTYFEYFIMQLVILKDYFIHHYRSDVESIPINYPKTTFYDNKLDSLSSAVPYKALSALYSY